jgi:hypothetical protein
VTGEGEHTEVDTAELSRFADGLDDRADRTAKAADTILGGEAVTIRFEQLSESFGLIATVFAGGAIDDARRTAGGIHTLAENLKADARLTRDSAAEFDSTNQRNADRFRSLPHE